MNLNSLVEAEAKLKKNGFIIGKLNNVKIIKNIKKDLEFKLKNILNKNTIIKLENYHKLDLDKEEHFKVQWFLSKYFIQKKYHIKIVLELLNVAKFLIGSDLLIQKKPYIRIARPNIYDDNIGFHKDTMYGQSPFEISIHTPLVNLSAKSCLKYVPNSHLLNEKNIKLYKNKISKNNNVKRNSYLHKLGFPYNPKKINISKYKEKNFKVRLGEYVLFSPALIHGQEINKEDSKTRFSFDTRLTNLYSPINMEKRGPNGKYEKLVDSSVTILNNDYNKNQK